MQTYKAPLRDMRFVLHELHGSADIAGALGDADADRELIDSVLDEAAKIAETMLLPLNASGDRQGCTYENGVVRTPAGFREAYATFRDGGWVSLADETRYGGQGLPLSLAKVVDEMVCAANMAFQLYPGLTHGACVALERHASEDLKTRYLPKLVSGEWAGTMCLTEAQCGTDLGLIRTRATPQGDGGYRLDGEKIFVSSGEHDLTDNIVHLVLARLPDAPPGIRGISLFLVPKFLPTPEGAPGARNGVACAGIEHKMGLKASATCQMRFTQAQGWLVGAPHAGMRAMFTMMNRERLAVGIQGLGVAEAAYQSAVAYARERLQGRAASGARHPDKPADPILVHADVRRMLMRMRADVEGCRALSGWVARALDRARAAPDDPTRRDAEDFAALMTPIVKALFTDVGFETASLAVQVYGGHGYIRDHGVEQYVRDARIAMLYEGTNGIQALDLVRRKVPAQNGRLLRGFFHPVSRFLTEHRDHPTLAPWLAMLEEAVGTLRQATVFVAEAGGRDPEEAAAAATDYLRLFGRVAQGFMWARMAHLAANTRAAEDAEAAFYGAKLATARFFFERMLPETGALLRAIRSGKGATMALDDASF